MLGGGKEKGLNGEAGGGEDKFLVKTQNASTMASYFGDFKILMQRVKDFGQPVFILLEADGHGFLQQQTSSNPNAYAAVAATGLPELAGLPNTVAGWGLAFLQLRKSVGASNAILGIHISGWASGKDVAHYSVTDLLQPEVDKVYNFLAPFGLASNVTGQTYDVLVGDPLDRDADFYKLTRDQDRWWDPADSASINSKSFNRYAEWLKVWNVKSNKRWVLWQIPCGNSNQLNVPYSAGTPRSGYKDNRITSVLPYVQQGAGGSWTWTGNWQAMNSFTPNTWKTITVQVPANAATPLYHLGVEFSTNAAWSGTVYIDSVSW